MGMRRFRRTLYHRIGHASPEDVAAHARSEGGIPDDQAVGDLAASMRYLRSLPNSNGKVGAFGTCSGGRHVMSGGFEGDRGSTRWSTVGAGV